MVKPLLLALALSACTQKVVYQQVPIYAPPRPVLPLIMRDKLQCLSDETYTAIVERDRALKTYSESLEALIEATHE